MKRTLLSFISLMLMLSFCTKINANNSSISSVSPFVVCVKEDYKNDTSQTSVTGGVSNISAKAVTITSWANINIALSSGIKIGIIYDVQDQIDKSHGKQVTISNSSLEANGKYSIKITTLTPNTKYYYRSFVYMGGLWFYGEILSFSTINEGITLLTGDANNITCYSANLNANIILENGISQSSCYYGICYSLSENPTVNDEKIRAVSKDENGSYMVSLTGISCNTKYYYRAYATYNNGTYYGEVHSFQTQEDNILITGNAVMEGNNLTVKSKLLLNGGTLNSIVVGLCFSKNDPEPSVNNTQYTTTELNSDFSYSTTFRPCNGKIYYRAFATIDNVTHYGRVECFDFYVEDTKQYVDLGLPSGILWATNNVGAQRPEEFGDYFAWGETDGYRSGKRNFERENYKFYDTSAKGYTKYCNDKSKWAGQGEVDRKWTLDPEDDAATVNWGQEWRMPTLKECQELLSCCYWKFCRYNNVKGYLVFKRLERDSTPIDIDNSFTSSCAQAYDLSCPHIFFPQAGRIEGTKFSNGSNEYEVSSFWSSSMSDYNSAYFLSLSNCVETWNGYSKHYYGFSIRPVKGIASECCNKPVITIVDGKIVVTTLTEGALCNTSITSTDMLSTKDKEIELCGVYTITTYASKAGLRNSEPATATLVWANPTIEGTGVMSMEMKKALLLRSNGSGITVEGLEEGEILELYNTNGMMLDKVASYGTSATLGNGLQKHQIYIIKAGDRSIKYKF